MDKLEFEATEWLTFEVREDGVLISMSRELIQEYPVSIWIDDYRLPSVIEFLTKCSKELKRGK
uniref:Uncharacterized protein n=1 Tax=viral metagenome TaxID=1070528 RepID=A0A6M3LU42_9ZZZZ